MSPAGLTMNRLDSIMGPHRDVKGETMTVPDRKLSSPEHPDGVSQPSPTTVVQGEISCREDLVIRGQVRGKMELPENDLLVDEGGRVEAEVRAKNVRIKGNVGGTTQASGAVVPQVTGRL